MLYKGLEWLLRMGGVFKTANVTDEIDKRNAVKVLINIVIMLGVILLLVKGVIILL
jgi:cytochrome b subunit of formate dehydrogenase